MTGSVAEGATQPEDVATTGTADGCRKTSHLIGPAGLLSNGLAKQAS